jgi:hypothetical protein
MPQPLCDTCGKRVTPDDRVTVPAELDDAGVTVRPSTSWHKECVEDEVDAHSEVGEGPYPGHEEAPFWRPH